MIDDPEDCLSVRAHNVLTAAGLTTPAAAFAAGLEAIARLPNSGRITQMEVANWLRSFGYEPSEPTRPGFKLPSAAVRERVFAVIRGQGGTWLGKSHEFPASYAVLRALVKGGLLISREMRCEHCGSVVGIEVSFPPP